MTRHEVAIVGGGPAGLGAARRLRALGIADLVVLEREAEAGGVPRHCGHPGFGWAEFRRLWCGPRYAAELRRAVAGIEIRTGTSVLEVGAGGTLHLATPRGLAELSARRVLLATGIRETPRSARLVGGERPQGVTTTGALQQAVYCHGHRPFLRPVIVGSELVAFSALLTCRRGGIRPLALLESGARIVARRPADLVARLAFGVPVLTETRLIAIHGRVQVEAVTVERRGRQEIMACDGVIFTGRFVPEVALLDNGALECDRGSGGPVIDQYFRTSDPHCYAAGNMLHPVATAGRCWHDGVAAANALAAELGGAPRAAAVIPVMAAAPLRYVWPQRLVADGYPVTLEARVDRPARGRLEAWAGTRLVAARRLAVQPERRITLALPGDLPNGLEALSLRIAE